MLGRIDRIGRIGRLGCLSALVPQCLGRKEGWWETAAKVPTYLGHGRDMV